MAHRRPCASSPSIRICSCAKDAYLVERPPGYSHAHRGPSQLQGASYHPPPPPAKPTTAQSSRPPPRGESLGSPGAQWTNLESQPAMAQLGHPTSVPWSEGDWYAPIQVGVPPMSPARKSLSAAVPTHGSDASSFAQTSAQREWLPLSMVIV